MRIESIIRELNSRIVRYKEVANQSHYQTNYDLNMYAARALEGAITLIESYKTDETETTQVPQP